MSFIAGGRVITFETMPMGHLLHKINIFVLFSLSKHQDANSQTKNQICISIAHLTDSDPLGVNCVIIILLPHQRLPSLLHCGLTVEYVHSYYILLSVKLGFVVLGIVWFSGQKQTSLFWLFKEFLHLSTTDTFFKSYLNVFSFPIQRMFFAFWKLLKKTMVPINIFLSK